MKSSQKIKKIYKSVKKIVLFIIKMKATQTLLILLFVLLVNCQNLQTEVENSIYSPSKNMCNPILMRRLANPTSMVQDRDAFVRVLETLRFAPDPQTALNDLSYYSPRFVGTLMTYIQSIHILQNSRSAVTDPISYILIHILGQQVQAADPYLRNRCLSNFNVQDCRQPCIDTGVIATPNIENYTITIQPDCQDQQFSDIHELIRLTLSGYASQAQMLLYELGQEDSQIICNQMSSLNIVEQFQCISSIDNAFDSSSIQLYSDSISTWLFQNQEQLSSIMDRNDQSQFDIQMTRVDARKKNINLRSALNAVRNVINMKFGVGVFAEKSLRCIKAEYLLMQTL